MQATEVNKRKVMATLDNAARQALEALECHADIGIKADKAIYAMREALEQQQEPYDQLLHDLPKREWVGLSDKEVEEVSGSFTEFEGFKQGALWAEQKLKELNTCQL